MEKLDYENESVRSAFWIYHYRVRSDVRQKLSSEELCLMGRQGVTNGECNGKRVTGDFDRDQDEIRIILYCWSCVNQDMVECCTVVDSPPFLGSQPSFWGGQYAPLESRNAGLRGSTRLIAHRLCT